MPIYDYRCTSCGFEKEYLQKVSDPVMTICPTCHKETFVKKLTAAGFQLKGSGWYATDFRNNGKAASKPADGGAATETKPEGGDAKSDTKSAETATAAHACGSGACPSCS
jgi:putative FmdB family regulatory protein